MKLFKKSLLLVALAVLAGPVLALDVNAYVEDIERYGKYDNNLFYLTVAKSSKTIDSMGKAFEIKKAAIIDDIANRLQEEEDINAAEAAIVSHLATIDSDVWTDDFAEELQVALSSRDIDTASLRVRASRSYRGKDFEAQLKKAKTALDESSSVVSHLYFEEDDYPVVADRLTTKASNFQGQKLKILGRGELAFTFDDGPHLGGYTTRVLDALRDNGCKATFFQLGSAIKSSSTAKNIMARLAREGHDVGVHGWYHATKAGKPFPTMNSSQIRSDLTKATRVLTDAYGFAPCTFRAPYGEFRSSDFNILKDLGLTYVGWDIDTNDWRKKTPSQLAQETINLIDKRGKGIVLMHDVQKRTSLAIAQIISSVTAKGYKLVTIREKLGHAPISVNPQPQPTPPPVNGQHKQGVVTANSTLNVRSGPSTSHDKVGKVPGGVIVNITGQRDGWYSIEFKGMTGWVSGDYISIV